MSLLSWLGGLWSSVRGYRRLFAVLLIVAVSGWVKSVTGSWLAFFVVWTVLAVGFVLLNVFGTQAGRAWLEQVDLMMGLHHASRKRKKELERLKDQESVYHDEE